MMLPQLATWHSISGRYTEVNTFQATDLMLKLWSAKTNRSYDSLFAKCEHCSEWSSDPISGPVTEVP